MVRSRLRPCDVWLLTVPGLQPRISATSTTGRSQRNRSTRTACWRAGTWASASRSTACSSTWCDGAARSGVTANNPTRHQPRRFSSRNARTSMVCTYALTLSTCEMRGHRAYSLVMVSPTRSSA